MRWQSIWTIAAATTLAVTMMAIPVEMKAQAGTVLKAADTQKMLPASVYYKGQSAPTQLRNSGGVKFADGLYVLATMVDNSGYASDVQAKYQAYFIAETAIKVGEKNLPAGVYGIGFIAGNKLVVTDVGAQEVFTVDTKDDAGLKRPMPLQVMADPSAGFRLYSGRRYVIFTR